MGFNLYIFFQNSQNYDFKVFEILSLGHFEIFSSSSATTLGMGHLHLPQMAYIFFCHILTFLYLKLVILNFVVVFFTVFLFSLGGIFFSYVFITMSGFQKLFEQCSLFFFKYYTRFFFYKKKFC